MSDPESICAKHCPYRDEPNFEDLQARCRGLRIRLDEWQVVVDDDDPGIAVGELAKIACGSVGGPDKGIPTISIEDWQDTPLNPSELKTLYDQGLLPDQML